jgi:chromosomal replication initiation ATPase DnaA
MALMSRPPAARQLRLRLDAPARRRREDFITSGVNQAAVRLLDAWPAWLGGCLALVGPAGSGKSHLADAWLRRARGAALQCGPSLDELAELRGRPLLLEDADACPDDILFHLINMAAEPGASLLLTSRRTPALWSTDLPDLRSRLNALPVAELHEPDDEVLRGVLARLFRERHIRPPEDLFAYLLRRIERSVPAAREVVARLDEAAMAADRPISRALAREILEQDRTGDLFGAGKADKAGANL